MSTAAEILPLSETVTPSNSDAVADAVRNANAKGTAVYPIGGGTSLDYGLSPRKPGIGLSLAGMNRVLDHQARDMTITVEAGITMEALADTLRTERQWLPVDVPQPEQASLGGVIACAAAGPRRFGCGTMRDYVIGIHAVDGRGAPFKGGGRVVKNVAGYDFCKLLTGSLGSLGVITQVTLKIRPVPEQSALLSCDVPGLATAEKLLAAFVATAISPVAVDFVAGPAWQANGASNTAGRLVVGVEGAESEVNWMLQTLANEWRELGSGESQKHEGDAAAALWQQLREFSVDRSSPLVLKAKVLPSQICNLITIAQQIDRNVSVQAHAGSGIVYLRFAEFGPGDVSKSLVGLLQPACLAAGGDLEVLSSNGLGELTRQVQWGGAKDAFKWMTKVKQQFDPNNTLNPGRFVYENL